MLGNLLYRFVWGVIAVAGGVIIARGVISIWPGMDAPSFEEMADTIFALPTDGTSISGWKRLVRFTAVEEEDPEMDLMTTTLKGNNQITASAYLVRNISRGTVIAAQGASRALPIASITKLVTATIARREIAPTDRITISQHIVKTYGNTAGFVAGETFLARDLLYPLLMVSSNDAAEALAQNYGRVEFVRAMNQFAQDIGAYHTYFADPSGLSPANISTPADLAIILDWLHKNDPEVIEITELKSKTVRAHTWVNPTHFLNLSTYIGGKNGYLPEANRTGASLFRLGGEVYAVVVLNSSARDSDELTLLSKVGK